MERKASQCCFPDSDIASFWLSGSDNTEGEVIETEIQQEVVASFTLPTSAPCCRRYCVSRWIG